MDVLQWTPQQWAIHLVGGTDSIAMTVKSQDLNQLLPGLSDQRLWVLIGSLTVLISRLLIIDGANFTLCKEYWSAKGPPTERIIYLVNRHMQLLST